MEPVTIESEFSPNIEMQDKYILQLGDENVYVTVTSMPRIVRSWLEGVLNRYPDHPTHLLVGLGVQWSNNNPNVAATLQLCIGHRCLIFQLAHADHFPAVLRDFLVNRRPIFVGFLNHRDREMLENTQHHILVQPLVDLQEVANVLRGCRADASASELASELLGYRWIEMDAQVEMSDWNLQRLSAEQVKYATLDAFLAFLVAKHLHVSINWPVHNG